MARLVIAIWLSAISSNAPPWYIMSLERAIAEQVILSDLAFVDTLAVCFGHSPPQLPTVEAI